MTTLVIAIVAYVFGLLCGAIIMACLAMSGRESRREEQRHE